MHAKTKVAAVLAASLSLVLSACGGGGGGNQLDGGGSGGKSFSAPVAQNASFKSGTTMARLNKQGTIKIGTKFDQPLFGLKNINGELQGFDVAIGKIIAGQLGIPADKIKWVKTPSKNRELYLEQGKVDMVVATYTINDERAKRITFAGPYYKAGQDIMVKKSNNQITGPKSLKKTGAKVCSARGSTSSERIREYVKPSQLVLFDTYSKCADALANGQVQAVTTDNAILLGLVNERPDQFKLVRNTFSDEPYGVGLKNGDVAFCEFVNSALKKSAENGSYTEAWKATAGKVSKDTPKLPNPIPCK